MTYKKAFDIFKGFDWPNINLKATFIAISSSLRNFTKGSSKNNVTALRGKVQGLCNDSTKALVS